MADRGAWGRTVGADTRMGLQESQRQPSEVWRGGMEDLEFRVYRDLGFKVEDRR